MQNYNHKEIEKKWQEKWQENNLFDIDKKDNLKEKYYILDMFPYPSGSGLHIGHTESYTASDIIFRYKKMRGFNVLHSQGFDSFGLPAENYAIKTNIHPKKTTENNIKNYINQIKSLGFGYDLKNLVITSNPEYYRHTQSIFGKFFKNNLVVKKTDTINWCSSCNTGIANEQVVSGECERCDTKIEQKKITGFFFKITDFSQKLIDDLDKVDWPDSTIKNQRNWIGRSEGIKIKFPIKHYGKYVDIDIEVFTTRPDTLFGATYLVLSPEHKLIQEFLYQDLVENPDEINDYIKKVKNKTEIERLEGKEKTGVLLKGIMATNLAREKSGMSKNIDIPIFIADYVLSDYGTGAVMAVPAHDERDFEFAKKFNLEIIEVISGGNISKSAYINNGVLINSGDFDNVKNNDAKKSITEFVHGKTTLNYRLRDWSISRQRYWGCPIPIVYDLDGKAHYVGDENLPWLLPEDVDFIPTGIAPLAKSKELKERTEKIFGKGWIPEIDTMDTFVDSSWYFLRYADTNNEKMFCSKEMLKKWLPVDLYIGGSEHTYMHLLFARFFIKAMKKIGMIDFDEPFLKLRHQGMVLDKNGRKMSKSKGNVVNPEDMIEKFGADTVRTYIMFSSPLEDDVIWNENNIVGISRFLEKVVRQSNKITEKYNLKAKKEIHKTINRVTKQIEDLKLNTAISDMMKLANFLDKEKEINKNDYIDFLKILSPFAPHITDELFEKVSNNNFLLIQSWPEFDEYLIKDEKILLTVQVNGKKRGEIEINLDASENEVIKKAKENKNIGKWLKNDIKKIIYIPNKILNFVASV